MTDTVLQTRGLSKSYGGKPALDQVDLRVAAGEFVALLGPNGAGKSTLMQLLTGLFVPDAGDLSVLGHDMRREPTRALAGLGVVFQQSALDADLSVASNLRFHTDLHGMPRPVAAARIAEGLAMLQMTDMADKVVRTLSGGNRRKVELVRAMLHAPRVLLMDEATVGLDPASRAQLTQAVVRLAHDQGVGVLWATHLVEEVQHADRLVVLNRGRVAFDGPADDLVRRSGAASLEQAFLAISARPTGGPGEGGKPAGPRTL